MTSFNKSIGVIGAGGIVFNSHAPLLRAMGADLRWILDADKARAQALAEAYGIPLALGADELARTTPTEVVLVACPYGVRTPYYDFLRDNPAALYIEKPVARSIAELERICAMRPHYAIAAGFLRRCDGTTGIVKRLIEDRLFGGLRRVRSEFGTATVISSKAGFAKKLSLAGGGQLFESAIHNIDAICYAAGIETALVRACRMEAERGFDLETEALIELTAADGGRIAMELLVTCFRSTQYGIEMEFDRASLKFSLFKKAPPLVTVPGGHGAYKVLDAVSADHPKSALDTLYAFWSDFFSGLESRRTNHTSAYRSMATTSIIEQLYESGLRGAGSGAPACEAVRS